ncbi:ASCH domain-containing protein [Anabaena azotica]|uniref:ASCH domain-containing protein n=1 Tax=Anabaena azotica TaxID=197653 RepID=UPI0039A4C27C
MKALSLWQPWASLIAIKAKSIETRSWYTSYRGELLICAAKTMNTPYRDYYYSLPVIPMLSESDPVPFEDLPRGKAVAKVRLVNCVKITQELIYKTPENEKLVGDWKVGRFAMILDEIQAIEQPFYVKGQQGIFEVDFNG